MHSLDILYEDEALLFVNKPPGIVVQRAYDPDEPVLFELAAAHAGPLFLLQRLDRGTSGVLFFSKLASINPHLTRQIEAKSIRKRYAAIAEGAVAERQSIDAPIRRIGAIKFGVGPGGKRAVTHVLPVAATASGSFLALGLETGRTHQIRVHLAAIGHPLAGDWLYGDRNAVRPMLHALALEMRHPVSQQALRVRAPLPIDFQEELARRGIALSGNQDDPTSLERT
ncbi:MAG TPA: RluA family pseudouridine synthase [Thermoanaerobaculia bacterium]|nr:RluA family pseudouridine synthase [Thermoanaerobaculia bacterium]